jgi:hypothetical protein
MGDKKKKKKKSVLNKRDVANTETRFMLSSIIHGDDSEDFTDRVKGLIDSDDVIDPERLADIIRNRVERGESAAEIAYYKHEVLKAVCSHVQVQGRAEMTRKKDMAVALVKHFGGSKKQWKDV